MAIPLSNTQDSKQKNPLEDLVQEQSEIISPAIKGKTKLDEVTEAAITIFGGRILDTN